MPDAGTKRALPSKSASISPPLAKRKVQSTTTKTAVANFFKPVSQKEPDKMAWRVVGNTLLIGAYSRHAKNTSKSARTKVAAFDLDSTLIVTKSGNRHAKDEVDWKWWHDTVPARLRNLYQDGYRIIIFTNQAGLKNPKKTESPVAKKFKLKVAAVLKVLDIPLTLYAACGHDEYRKPGTRMWEEMKEDYDMDVHGIEPNTSYLVGDAAGRERDFSDSDKIFSQNVGIGFFTPEEFFLEEVQTQQGTARQPHSTSVSMADILKDCPPRLRVEEKALTLVCSSGEANGGEVGGSQ